MEKWYTIFTKPSKNVISLPFWCSAWNSIVEKTLPLVMRVRMYVFNKTIYSILYSRFYYIIIIKTFTWCTITRGIKVYAHATVIKINDYYYKIYMYIYFFHNPPKCFDWQVFKWSCVTFLASFQIHELRNWFQREFINVLRYTARMFFSFIEVSNDSKVPPPSNAKELSFTFEEWVKSLKKNKGEKITLPISEILPSQSPGRNEISI